MHATDWVPTILSFAGVDVNKVDSHLKDKVYGKLVTSQEYEYGGDGNGHTSINSFDGFDLSEWILTGDENKNVRKHLGIHMSSTDVTGATDTVDGSIAIVFESNEKIFYKFMYSELYDATGSRT